MKNHYKVLGVLNSATLEEIRRAYRILARRYHPDVNPGEGSAERFNEISEAYDILSNPEKRAAYDAEHGGIQRKKFDEKYRAFQEAQTEQFSRRRARERREAEAAKQASQPPPAPTESSTIADLTAKFKGLVAQTGAVIKRLRRSAKSSRDKPRRVTKVSIVEVSLTVEDAIRGVRKKIEIAEPEGVRKVSVVIPAGVRDGSVIRMRDRNESGEDLVLIVRLAAHQFIAIKPKGIVIEIPVTVSEALAGAQITVPGIEDQLVVKIPAGSQSGSEIRVKEQGIAGKDGVRGDLFVRLLIRIPEPPEAVGLKDKAKELEQYYSGNIREGLPRTLLA